MKLVAILAIISAAVTVSSAGNIVCYFQSWTIYRADEGQFGAVNVDPNLCTHLVYTSVGLNETGHLQILDDWEVTGLDEINHLISLKEINADLKIIVSMGGYNVGAATFSIVAADPELVAVLVADAVSFVQENGFDGFELDWEYPGQGEGSDPEADPVNYVTLLQALKDALSVENYSLSINVNGGVWATGVSYPDITAISDIVDLINVKTYDYHGDWEDFVGHYAPLYPSHLDATPDQQNYNAAAGITRWLDGGADPLKLTLGIGTYGRTFTLVDPTLTDLYSPANGTGTLGPYTNEDGLVGYYEICSLYTDWEKTFDDEQKVPHIVNEDQWIGYEDVDSVQLKVDLANNLALGGVNVWSLDTDDFGGLCGDLYPLLTVINLNLK